MIYEELNIDFSKCPLFYDMRQIQHFQEFTDFYQVLGYPRTTTLPDFDILKFDESRHVRIPFMPPFRKNWYQVVFKLNPVKSVWLNADAIEPKNTVLLFNSPHHVYSWQLDTALKGFILFFKPDFVSATPNFEYEFPFFQLTETNQIEVPPNEIQEYDGQINQLLTTSTTSNQYKRQIIQSLLVAFLYRCKSAYHQQQGTGQQAKRPMLVNRFRQLVATFYLEKRTVADYAQLLHITPNYLNEVVKETTGSTARHFIVERLLTEAKNLLRHTDLDISTIAYSLQFDEPTNFGKFFKKYLGLTPGQFRDLDNQKSE